MDALHITVYPLNVWCHLVPPPILLYAHYLTRDIIYSIFIISDVIYCSLL